MRVIDTIYDLEIHHNGFVGWRFLMHILIYCDDPGAGGTSVNASVLGEGLASLGLSISIAAYGEWISTLTGITPYNLDYNPQLLAEKAMLSRNEPEKTFLHVRPDLVLFCDSAVNSNIAAKLVCREWGIPYIVQVNYVSRAHLSRLRHCLALAGHVLRGAEAVAAVSTENLLLLRQFFCLSELKSSVIYNGRPRGWFEPASPILRASYRAAWGIGPDDLVCLTVARYEPRKGYKHLLEAAAEITEQGFPGRRTLFVWIGQHQDGAAENLAANVASRGLSSHVRVLGERKDIREWLAASDIFVLTSESEGMPLCIIEAMSQCVPVIASAISGIPEELGDAGILVPDPGVNPSGAVRAVVTAVTALSYNADLRRKLGVQGRERAQAYFTADRMVEDFARLIYALAAKSKPLYPDARSYCPKHLIIYGDEVPLGGDSAIEYLKEGWGHGEGDGRWTDGDYARLCLALLEINRGPLVLTLRLKPFVIDFDKYIKLNLYFNGKFIGSCRWDEPVAEPQRISFGIYQDSNASREVELVFSIIGACSPSSLGLSSDTRHLGVWVTHLQLDRVGST